MLLYAGVGHCQVTTSPTSHTYTVSPSPLAHLGYRTSHTSRQGHTPGFTPHLRISHTSPQGSHFSTTPHSPQDTSHTSHHRYTSLTSHTSHLTHLTQFHIRVHTLGYRTSLKPHLVRVRTLRSATCGNERGVL